MSMDAFVKVRASELDLLDQWLKMQLSEQSSVAARRMLGFYLCEDLREQLYMQLHWQLSTISMNLWQKEQQLLSIKHFYGRFDEHVRSKMYSPLGVALRDRLPTYDEEEGGLRDRIRMSYDVDLLRPLRDQYREQLRLQLWEQVYEGPWIYDDI